MEDRGLAIARLVSRYFKVEPSTRDCRFTNFDYKYLRTGQSSFHPSSDFQAKHNLSNFSLLCFQKALNQNQSN